MPFGFEDRFQNVRTCPSNYMASIQKVGSIGNDMAFLSPITQVSDSSAIWPKLIPPTLSPFHFLLIILSSDATKSEILTMSLYKSY
jgi:hypothetical protein